MYSIIFAGFHILDPGLLRAAGGGGADDQSDNAEKCQLHVGPGVSEWPLNRLPTWLDPRGLIKRGSHEVLLQGLTGR